MPTTEERVAAARAAREAQAAPAESTTDGQGVEAGPVADDSAGALAASLPPEPTTNEKIAINAEAERQRRVEALRARRAAGGNDAPAEAMVKVRVLKAGHGMISTGEHAAGLGDLTYDRGETPSFPLSVAQALEDAGLVEIEEGEAE